MKKIILTILIVVGSILVLTECRHDNQYTEILLRDDFSSLDTGIFSAPAGPLTEYHYISDAGTKGNWTVSHFISNRAAPSMLPQLEDSPYFNIYRTISRKDSRAGWGTAWQVKKDDDEYIMHQTFQNEPTHERAHPMIIAGDSLWRNYKMKVEFSPENDSLSSGIAFRYKNSRQYYFFGIKKSSVFISKINHGADYRVLNEEILAERSFDFVPGQDLKAIVTVRGNSIEARLNNYQSLKVNDDTFSKGKVGLVSSARAQYKEVEVLTSDKKMSKFKSMKKIYEQEAIELQESIPEMVVWKKINTEGFGMGRNLRFGDLNMDGQIDVLIGQVDWHNEFSELNCLTAMTFDGEVLWQIGEPNADNYVISSDVAFQIHDFTNNGRNEVIYTMNNEIIVADGASGNTLFKTATPTSKITNKKIVGDALFFFDSEGKGYDGNLLIKDRYSQFWVMNNKLETLWKGSDIETGHYPYAADIDGDGKDALAIGYSLYDSEGTLLWNLDEEFEDHADGVAIVNFSNNPDDKPVIAYSGSDDGYMRVDLDGNILIHYNIGHVQNSTIANFRSDKSGLETVTINSWGNNGLIHFLDQNGNIYHDFEPNPFGSMLLPLNWTGTEEEYFVHNASHREGGIYDGYGKKVLEFPDDGHPELTYAVLDITGDVRDEIVVWDQNEIWVYTQSDNPKNGKLYQPIRNPLYNYSNYQTTVSLPGWNTD